MENSIKLNLKPDGEWIESAGQKGSHFLKSHGVPDDTVKIQIRMLNELIKNGLSYGRLKPSNNEISIGIQVTDSAITIEVLNPIDTTRQDRLKEFDETIRFIRGYQDPFEAYTLLKQKILNSSSAFEAPYLDLIKTACDANMVLDFFINENNILNQSAVHCLSDN